MTSKITKETVNIHAALKLPWKSRVDQEQVKDINPIPCESSMAVGDSVVGKLYKYQEGVNPKNITAAIVYMENFNQDVYDSLLVNKKVKAIVINNAKGSKGHELQQAQNNSKTCIKNYDLSKIENETEISIDINEHKNNEAKIYKGRFKLVPPQYTAEEQELIDQLIALAEMKVLANADTAEAIEKAILESADGIGLIRTENMFTGGKALKNLFKLAFSEDGQVIKDAKLAIYTHQYEKVREIFNVCKKRNKKSDFPIKIRLLDSVGAELATSFKSKSHLEELLGFEEGSISQEKFDEFKRLRSHELAEKIGDFYDTQIHAIFAAAKDRKIEVDLQIMVPEIHNAELATKYKQKIADIAKQYGFENRYKYVPMIESQEAFDNAYSITDLADDFSVGSNDATASILKQKREDAAKNSGKGENAFVILNRKVAIKISEFVDVALKKSKNSTITICGGQVAGHWKSILRAVKTGVTGISVPPELIKKSRFLAGLAVAAIAQEKAIMPKIAASKNIFASIEPIAPDKPQENNIESILMKTTAPKKINALVIDDEERLATSMSFLLGRKKNNMIEKSTYVTSYKDAVELMQTLPKDERPTLWIVDLQLINQETQGYNILLHALSNNISCVIATQKEDYELSKVTFQDTKSLSKNFLGFLKNKSGFMTTLKEGGFDETIKQAIANHETISEYTQKIDIRKIAKPYRHNLILHIINENTQNVELIEKVIKSCPSALSDQKIVEKLMESGMQDLLFEMHQTYVVNGQEKSFEDCIVTASASLPSQ